jgi:hypothetical protein
MKIKNKKADSAVTILVVMTLVLVATGLFSFLTIESKKDKMVLDINTVSELYRYSDALDFFMRDYAREVIKSNPSIKKEEFILAFKTGFKDNAPKEYQTDFILNQINNNEYEVRIENNKLKFNLKGFRTVKSFPEDRQIKAEGYTRDIIFEIDF